MYTTVFCDVVPCNLVEIDRRFRGDYCLRRQGPDDGGSKHLLNVGQFQGPDDGGSKHSATSQKTVIFILAAVRTLNLSYFMKLPRRPLVSNS
jgi:hypothetical protein